jgi:hypothetical protein
MSICRTGLPAAPTRRWGALNLNSKPELPPPPASSGQCSAICDGRERQVPCGNILLAQVPGAMARDNGSQIDRRPKQSSRSGDQN